MTKLVRNLVVALWCVVCAMGIMLWVINVRLTASPPGLAVGKPMIDVNFTSHDNRQVRIKDYIGRPVFLVMAPSFADTTVSAVRSLESKLGFLEAAGGKVFLLANTTQTAASDFHTKNHMRFPILIDLSGSVAHTLGVDNTRLETIVVDSKGFIKFHIRDVDARQHGPQLLAFARTCNEEVAGARSKGLSKVVKPVSSPDVFTGQMTPVYGDKSQRATVVVFISVLCPCSNAYNERIKKLQDSARLRGIRVVIIYSSADETPADAASHAKQSEFRGPVLYDGGQLVMKHFTARVTPEVFVMNQTGILRYAGRIDDRREQEQVKNPILNRVIEALLKGEKVPDSEPAFGCAITTSLP